MGRLKMRILNVISWVALVVGVGMVVWKVVDVVVGGGWYE